MRKLNRIEWCDGSTRPGVVSPIAVVAAPDQELPGLPDGVLVVRDEEKGRGPLQGLAAGLTTLQGRADAAYLSSCDVPFLRPAFVKRMIDLHAGHGICVPRIGGYHHPLAAVYRGDVVDAVRQIPGEFLLDGSRASGHGVIMDATHGPLDLFLRRAVPIRVPARPNRTAAAGCRADR